MAERGVLGAYYSPPISAEEPVLAGLEGWMLGIR